MDEDIKEFRMMADDESGDSFNCDLIFEEDMPYAVWPTCPERFMKIKLEPQYLEPFNNFRAGEFVHFFYKLPISKKNE